MYVTKIRTRISSLFSPAKAYNTVAHNTLICVLNNYDIRGLAFHWFKGYLTERKQFTFFKRTSSEKKLSHMVCHKVQ